MIPTIFIGPVPPPITGLAVSVQYIYKNYAGEKYLINLNYTNCSKLKKIVILSTAFLKLLVLLITKPSIKRVYFTSAITKEGVIRDIIFLTTISFFKVKIINHLYGAGFDTLLRKLPKWLFVLALKSYGKIDTSIVLMNEMKSEFDLFKGLMKLEVVPLFYDQILDDYTHQASSSIEYMINFSFYSNLFYSKGITYTLEAFDILSKKYSYIHLNIAGDFMGDSFKTKENIKKNLETYSTNHNITYHGVVRGEKKKNFLSKSDVLIFPSFYEKEGFPISIIEAMRCGNAIITTNHNYLHYIINKRQGIVVEKQSVEQIIHALEVYLRDLNLLRETQEYNSLFAKNNFSLDIFIKRVHKIINSEE